MRTTITLALAALSLAASTPVANADVEFYTFIQPGRAFTYCDSSPTCDVGLKGCGIGFLLIDSAGKYWATTAGHCANDGASSVRHPNFGFWGEFVWWNQQYDAVSMVSDIGLIRIYDDFQQYANPSVHKFGGPTGMITTTLPPGRLIAHSGMPGPFSQYTADAGRLGTGPLTYHDGTSWKCQCEIQTGDSGSPFLDVGLGKALGVLSGTTLLLNGDTNARGANFNDELARIHAAGYTDLQLATAPLIPL